MSDGKRHSCLGKSVNRDLLVSIVEGTNLLYNYKMKMIVFYNKIIITFCATNRIKTG